MQTLHQLISNFRVIADIFTVPTTWLMYVTISLNILVADCYLMSYARGGE